jgi:hypothetical protein
MPYEIQHNTLTDGWINNWLYDEGDGVLRLETFASPQEAEAALDEHLRDLLEEFYAGNIKHYDHEAYRIRYVPDTQTQPNHQQGEHS